MVKDPKRYSEALARIESGELTDIDLSGKELTDGDAVLLAAALEKNPQVSVLMIHGNKIGDRGISAIARALEKNTALEDLNLSYNSIGGAGTKVLAESLKHSQKLEDIGFYRNPIGDEGAEALGELLKTNRSLKNLPVGNCNITAKGAAYLAEGLKHNNTLTNLALDRNDIKDEGAKALSAALANNDTLLAIGVEDAGITDAGIHAFADLLETNHSITAIELARNAFTQEGLAELESKIIGNYPSLSMFDGFSIHINKYCAKNREAAADLTIKAATTPDLLTADDMWDISLALPIFRYFHCQNRTSSTLPSRLETLMRANGNFVLSSMDNYQAVLSGIPTADVTQPLTWEMLNVVGENGFTALDHPETWRNLDRVIATLNKNGQRTGASCLVEDGKPAPILERAMARGKLPVLFTEDNWRGATHDELKSVIKAIPEEARSKIPNLHTLTAQVRRQNEGRERN